MVEAARPGKTFWKALGPGLLWAGAAVGVSHLVQSTRAGASFGLGLVGVVILANVFKYPAFSFGPRYAAATGTSLLEGYRRQGRWALALYGLLTLGTMFTVQAAVTVVTGGLFAALIGWRSPLAGFPPAVWLSGMLTAVCAGLLAIGHYRWLDRIVKVVVAVLTVTTLGASLLVLPSVPWETVRFLPRGDWMAEAATVAAIVGLIGWMPSAFDVSVWHSLWTLARRRETGHAPSVREALVDFNVGYLGTALLALCFVALGAGVMFGSGEKFADQAGAFAGQVIALYTKQLGEWARPVIATSAFTVMFSTTLTVCDGFPRALATLAARFRGEETPGKPDSSSRFVYWGALAVLGVGSLAIIAFFAGTLKTLVNLATTLSFLTAPALAWLNHRAILGREVPVAARPGRAMAAFSWSGILFSLGLALYYVWIQWLAS